MIIKIDPVPAPRMTRSDKWAARPCVTRYFNFRNELWEAYQQFLPVPCSLVFTLPMPQEWPPKKKARHNGTPHCQKPDIDNLCKSVLDALLKDDSHVWSIRAEKYWGDEGSIEITGVK